MPSFSTHHTFADFCARVRKLDRVSVAHMNMAAVAAAGLITVLIWTPLRFGPLPKPAGPLAPAPSVVKMIDAAPRAKDCAEQTWPYIDQKCLTYASGSAASTASAPAPVKAAEPVPASEGKTIAAPAPRQGAPVTREATVDNPALPRAARSEPDDEDYEAMIAQEQQQALERERRARARAERRRVQAFPFFGPHGFRF